MLTVRNDEDGDPNQHEVEVETFAEALAVSKRIRAGRTPKDHAWISILQPAPTHFQRDNIFITWEWEPGLFGGPTWRVVYADAEWLDGLLTYAIHLTLGNIDRA